MAQKIITTLVDDIDGGEADETIRFGLDGVEYEIDLKNEHADELRGHFIQYVEKGRRVGGKSRGGQNGGRGGHGIQVKGHVPPDLGAVRAWARENGHAVSERGRISATVMEAYDNRKVHPVKPADTTSAVTGRAVQAAASIASATAPGKPQEAPQAPEETEGEVKPKPTRKRAASGATKRATAKRGIGL